MCYTLVSNAMQNCKASSPLARLCLQTMAHISATGEYWESASKLAERCGATVRGVQKALARLIEAGDVEVLRRGGGRQTTLYRLTAALTGDDSETRPGCPAAASIANPSAVQEAPSAANDVHSTTTPEFTPDTNGGRSSYEQSSANKERYEIERKIPLSAESAEPPSTGQQVWSEARRILPDLGVPKAQVGKLMGRWLKTTSEERMLEALWAAERKQPGDVVSWITAGLKARAVARKNVVYIQGVAVQA